MPIAEHLKPSLIELLLAAADDKLMLGHRNSDWTGLGPILEEDIAFSSLAQDEIAHAQTLYEFLGPIAEKDENELAFGRTAEEYRCATIVEPHDEFDWAAAITRQFFCDHFDRLRFRRLAQSNLKPLADLAKRIGAEEQVHVDHADSWMRRLGRGTTEGKQRVQKALDQLAPLAVTLFEPVDGEPALEKDGLYPALEQPMIELWRHEVDGVLKDADLSAAFTDFDPSRKGGRRGIHGAAFGELLEEMSEVYRIEPGAKW